MLLLEGRRLQRSNEATATSTVPTTTRKRVPSSLGVGVASVGIFSFLRHTQRRDGTEKEAKGADEYRVLLARY